MYMAYSKNPHLPRVRMEAVLLVRSGWSTTKVARRFGYRQGTVSKWAKRAPRDGRKTIPTESSRPHRHPRALAEEIVSAIVQERRKRKRCAEVIHEELKKQGIVVSLSSVKRTLSREGLLRERSPWKRWHSSLPRPYAQNAGDLVQVDTIHIQRRDGTKFYIYTLIDLASRWAYACVSTRINTHRSLRFILQAQRRAPFRFLMLQSDHGSEFSSWLTEQLGVRGVGHRHSRVRQSNDNGHIERFNRTIQEECFDALPVTPEAYQNALSAYLRYYNNERLHLGINLLTPLQKIAETIPSY